MASSHDFGATPPTDLQSGRAQVPDGYTVPANLRDRLTERLGPFPLFSILGPERRSLDAVDADATKLVMTEINPTLTLAYLPHLIMFAALRSG